MLILFIFILRLTAPMYIILLIVIKKKQLMLSAYEDPGSSMLCIISF